MNPLAVVALSGGMDSSTLVYMLRHQQYDLLTYSVDYGQRHRRELECSQKIAHLVGAREHILFDLRQVQSYLVGSALTDVDRVAVPEGHYAAPNMALTVVPNRNMLLLALGGALAVAQKATALAYAAHAGDHEIYPDTRPEWIQTMRTSLKLGNYHQVELLTPFQSISKGVIVSIGLEVGVPYEHTWTCYRGSELSCGRCGSCCERLEAFAENGAQDPLEYEDREFYKTVIPG